jgi:hypothetical protein
MEGSWTPNGSFRSADFPKPLLRCFGNGAVRDARALAKVLTTGII